VSPRSGIFLYLRQVPKDLSISISVSNGDYDFSSLALVLSEILGVAN